MWGQESTKKYFNRTVKCWEQNLGKLYTVKQKLSCQLPTMMQHMQKQALCSIVPHVLNVSAVYKTAVATVWTRKLLELRMPDLNVHITSKVVLCLSFTGFHLSLPLMSSYRSLLYSKMVLSGHVLMKLPLNNLLILIGPIAVITCNWIR